MILKVNKDICEIKQNEVWNVGDYNVHTVQVELSDEFDGLVNKVRYFIEDICYDMLITNNIAEVPYEATLTEGTIKIGVYGYDADTNILVQSTSPVNKYISSGTYTGEADNTEPLTPTDKQQMESAIQKNADDIINLQNNKQDVLISGENIKTINNESILGTGNIEIDVGSIDYNELENKPKINNVELTGNKTLNNLGIQPAGNYATMNDLTEESRAILTEVATSYYNKTQTNNLLNNKQNTLISGQNIKTINNESIVGEGNITIQGGGTSDYTDLTNKPSINNVILSGNKTLNDLGIQPKGNYIEDNNYVHTDNNFNNTYKNKLEGLENYDDTEIKADISDIQDEQVEQNTDIENLQEENERLKATLPTTTGEGQDITLDKTAEMEFVKPPLPRGNTKQDTTTGKNLLNTINANTTTVNGVTSYRSNGVYYLSGTNTKTDATWVLPNTQNTNLPVFEIGQTYTMSFKGTLPSGVYAQLNGVQTSTGTQYSLGSVRRTVPSLTFTIDSDYSSTAQLFIGIQGETTNVDCNFAIQIEKGSTATSYEPYTGGIPSPNPDYPQEVEVVTGNVEVTISNENNTESKTLPVSLGNIELCKIGDYQDYLYKNNGKWYKYNAINKLVLNGSENWSAHGSIASWFFWDGITDGFVDNTISGYALSNYFTQKAYRTVTSLKNGEFAYGQVAGETRKRFVLKDTDYTTLADFKTWLSNNNVLVYYVLATPTDTEITDATLISQLEEISKTLSYQGQTNITSNTIAMFDVEAYQSTKLILENLDSRLTLVEG